MRKILTTIAAVLLAVSVSTAAPSYADKEGDTPGPGCDTFACPPADPLAECQATINRVVEAFYRVEARMVAAERRVVRLDARIDRKNATIQRLRQQLRDR